MWIKPTNPDVKVPDPTRQGEAAEIYYLPVDGRNVGDENPFYWLKRIREGDAVECEAPAPSPAPAPQAEPGDA